MLHCKIKIELPRIKKDIPQCKRCQGFGHTQNYCQRQAKCVKCDGNNHSLECKKPRKEAYKYVNCGESHTANWKGCVVYKNKVASLQRIRTTVTQRVQQKVGHITRQNIIRHPKLMSKQSKRI